MQQHAPAQAKVHFSAALKINPHLADALTWRGIAEEQLGEYTVALADFEAALRIDPSFLSARYNLALTCLRLKNTHRALEEMRLVVNAEPGVFEAQYNLALLLEQAGAPGEAIEHLKAAERISPGDNGVIQHLLLDLMAEGASDQSQAYLDALARTSSPEALKSISVALLESRHFPQAIYLLERAGQGSELDRETRLLLVRAYLGAHEDSKAIGLLQPMKATEPGGEAAYLLGLAFTDMGAGIEAKDAFALAVKEAPRNASALFHLGMLESEVPDQLPIAIGHLRDAVRIEPESVSYRMVLAKLLLEHDEAREAESLLLNTHAAGPESAERDLLLGIARIAVHGPRSATPVLESSVKENPSLALSHNMLGFCYSTQGEMDKAAESYAAASDLAPQNRLFAHAAAAAFDRAGNTQRQKQYAARAASRPDANAADHLLLAKGLVKTGDTENAVRQLNQAIVLDPDLEAAYYLLARCYMQEGKSAEASLWVEKLKHLKQSHQRPASEATKNPEPMRSSVLLRGTAAELSGGDTP